MAPILVLCLIRLILKHFNNILNERVLKYEKKDEKKIRWSILFYLFIGNR